MNDSADQTPTEVIILPDEATSYPWSQMEDEPFFWYQRFVKYFLPQGPGRTLLKAYETMVAAEHPDVAKARENSDKAHKAITSWSTKAREWNWRQRAKEFDHFAYRVAQYEVDKARVRLLGAADAAAKALVDALGNARLTVAAAKEILDRVGLPGTVNVGLGPIEKFTADEFRQAEQELQDWEQPLSPTPPALPSPRKPTSE